jgi:hypothetical protein
MAMLAHDPHVLAQRLVACEAIAAFVAKRLGKQNSLHARLQPGARLGFDDLAGGFHAHHLRQGVRDPGPVVAHIEIDTIERRCGDLEHRLGGGHDRIGKIPPADAFGSAPFQDRRLHDVVSFRSVCRLFPLSDTRLSYVSYACSLMVPSPIRGPSAAHA